MLNTPSIPSYARKLGVDVDNLLVSQPDNGEQALEIAASPDPLRRRRYRRRSTPSPLSSPKPNSKAKWAIRKWVCKRA